LSLDFSYSTNGKEIYEINLKTGEEKLVDNFLSPEEMWKKIYPDGTMDEKTQNWIKTF
jgi:type I restriction enzyme R subunit